MTSLLYIIIFTEAKTLQLAPRRGQPPRSRDPIGTRISMKEPFCAIEYHASKGPLKRYRLEGDHLTKVSVGNTGYFTSVKQFFRVCENLLIVIHLSLYSPTFPSGLYGTVMRMYYTLMSNTSIRSHSLIPRLPFKPGAPLVS